MTRSNLYACLWAAALLMAGCTTKGSQNDKPIPSGTAAEVTIPVAEQAGVIQSETVQKTEVPDIVRFPGQIALADNGKWRVGAITSGRIEGVFVSQGDYVHSGEVLARMHSHDVHEAKAAYFTAIAQRTRDESAVAFAQKNYDRTQRLYDLKAASLEQTELARQQLVDAQTALRSSVIAVERERAHLEDNLGISVSESVNQSDGEGDLIPIRSPANGYVLQKNVTPGTVVDLATDLFVVGELRHLWLIVSVPQEHLGMLSKGLPATISVNGLPEIEVHGRVTNVGEQFDSTTHSMQVRIEFENPGNRLRPEMLATAAITVGMEEPALFVPSDAVQQVDGQDSVFVQTSADRFVMRPVETASPVGDRVPIEDGLKPGEHVVIRGAFIVKSELLKSSMLGD